MKKKFLSFLLTLSLTAGLLSMGALAADGPLSETGTPDDPYLIADAAGLKAFRELANEAATNAVCGKLTADIDLGGEEWLPFMPVSGYATEAYCGTFDGNGHTIRGLYIDTAASNQGLFGIINGASIRNLSVEGNVTSSNNYVGGIVGKVQQGMIENCAFSGTVTTTKSGTSSYAGGITGYAGNSASQTAVITNCANNGTVTGGCVGGIAGYAKYSTIENCLNNGTVNGTGNAAGIVGQSMNATTVNTCGNTGVITGGANTAAIVGFNGVVSGVTNCYWTQPEDGTKGGIGTASDSEKVSDVSTLAEMLGDAFALDDGGSLILSWQAGSEAEPLRPSVSISSTNGTTLWAQPGDGHQTETTLSVQFSNVGEQNLEVKWSFENPNAATVEESETEPGTYIVSAKQGGMVTVSASILYEGETYTDTLTITVIPHITAAEIVNTDEAYSSNIAVGQTVKARVFVQGGGVFDPADYPGLALNYQWFYRPSGGSAAAIAGATGETFKIPASFREWDRVQVEVSCAGHVVCAHEDNDKPVRSADYGILYPVAYDADFTLPGDLKEDILPAFPAAHTKNGVTAGITWGVLNGSAFEAKTQEELAALLARPVNGKNEVTICARFAYGTSFVNRTFSVTVWSDAALAEESDSRQKELEQAVAALGAFYKLSPVYGTDTNLLTMVTSDLAAKGQEGISVSIKEITEIYGGAGIAKDGSITYFYVDPNTTPSVKNAHYQVSFTLSKNGACVDLDDVPVIIRWDAENVKTVMREEIGNKVDPAAILGLNPSLDNVTTDLLLPKVVDGKRWAQIDWSSSNESVISISRENQTAADTLFEPFVGKVQRGERDQTIRLTAGFTFRLTDGDEAPIKFYQTYAVTVKAADGEQTEAVRRRLEQKLEAGLAAQGLRDDVTGQTLDAGNVVNDIRFPTTRDFGVDGKYYPVTITSSDANVIEVPQGNNAAKAWVYRDLPGGEAKTVTLTITITEKATGISASREIEVTVQPLTQAEIDAEIALMERAKAAYFEGIRNQNTAPAQITGDLRPFQEVYEENGALVWVYSHENRVKHGIVPVAMNDWEVTEQWRLFRSSNPEVVASENLLVTPQTEHRAVTVTSYLSSETLGKYAEKYPENGELQKLYYQPVSVELVVRGTRPTTASVVRQTADVDFTLKDNQKVLFTDTCSGLAEGTTVFDVFRQTMGDHGYRWASKGSYVYAITTPDGKTLTELDEGSRSGWMYRLNGQIPGAYMGAHVLHDGDSVEVFFTNDYTQESGFSGSSQKETESQLPGTAPLFADVAADAWYADDVKFVCSKGLMQGVSDGVFAPGAPTTRAMIVQILYNLENKPASGRANYTDVPPEQWYSPAVDWATETGIVSGYENGTFGPGNPVTRQELAAILYRYAEKKGMDVALRGDLSRFTDHGNVSAWAEDAMAWAVGTSLFVGNGNGTITPDVTASRGEIAAVFHRFLSFSGGNNADSLRQTGK